MQNILTTIRSMKFIDGCKGTQVYAENPSSTVATAAEKLASLRTTFSLRSKSISQHNHPTNNQNQNHHHHTPSLDSLLSTFGLPSPDLIDPSIDPFLHPIEHVEALASSFRSLSSAISSPASSSLCDIHLEQSALFRCIGDLNLVRRALRSACINSNDIHHRIVLTAWLRFERREDELEPFPSPISCSATSPPLECPRAALYGDVSFDLCLCRCTTDLYASSSATPRPPQEENIDLWFCIGDEEIPCVRSRIASLSRPLSTLLYGGFAETRREHINFTHNRFSARAMRAVEAVSRGGCLNDYPPDTILEVLAFANRYCCESLKAACDSKLASIVRNVDDALLFIDYALEEQAYVLVAACLQVFLRGLPRSLQKSEVNTILCSPQSKERLARAGHASFVLYYFLSQVAMEEDMKSNTTVMLLERMSECAASGWQKQLAMHQLGCVMLERGEYKDAQKCFEAAVEGGHAYSVVGVARAKYKKGHKYSAYKLINSMISEHKSYGWMHQERSLYCSGNEKMTDLSTATELDPTLAYPYKYRAVILAEEDKLGAAVAEISKLLGFKISTDCLELRAWFYLALGNYELALQDIRVILTLDPGYMMFHGKMHGEQLIDTLQLYVQPWDMADCWMQLYDRWSAVDDIGSLAVVHQMLTKEPGNSSLRFRQSLLLLRLNCQKAAMHSLRMARNHSTSEHERLIYEGWFLYDTGHRKEGLAKAEESIALQRSFEAFFLKAYALADTSQDRASFFQVIQLLEQANSCASDNLRKGQAHNNMGSVYVDCDMLDEAAECYMKALGIKHTRAHQGLARVYYLKNNKEAAYDEMTKLIEKAQNNASAYEKRSEYCDRDMARSDLNMASKLDPLRTYPYIHRAAALMDDHKEEEAISELSRALSFKLDLKLLHLRASYYDSMGNIAFTLLDYEAALCIEPEHADTLELYNRARAQATEQQK